MCTMCSQVHFGPIKMFENVFSKCHCTVSGFMSAFCATTPSSSPGEREVAAGSPGALLAPSDRHASNGSS